MLSTSLKPPARNPLPLSSIYQPPVPSPRKSAPGDSRPPPRAPSIASNMACRHSIKYGDTKNQSKPFAGLGTLVEIDPESFLQLFFHSAANSLTKGLAPKTRTKKKHRNSNKWYSHYSHQNPSKYSLNQKYRLPIPVDENFFRNICHQPTHPEVPSMG